MEFCDDCNDEIEKSIPLLCKKHSICRNCLVKRARYQPDEVMLCNKDHREPEVEIKQAGVLDSDQSNKVGMWILVDDSTIWVEAKRLQSLRKGFLTSEDHRLRIDMGKLASVIASDRPVKKGILYAAEPPPIHEVWRNIELKAGWDVDRSELKPSHGEKHINAKLVAKATAVAMLTPPNERTTMAFVTGDANVIPALKKATNEMWDIEIYMWRDAISPDIYSFAAEHDNQIKICPLDEQLESISFFRYELDIHLKEIGSNLKEWTRRRQPMYRGAVFSIKPGAFLDHNLSREWIEKLEQIARWPFQYYWFLGNDNTKTDNLVVTFKRDIDAEPFDLANFLQNDLIKSLPHVISVKAYHEFIGKEYGEESSHELEKIDEALLQCDIQHASSPDASVASDSDSSSMDAAGFRSKTKKNRRSKQLYSAPCKYGKNCKWGSGCYSHHTKDEMDYFRKRRGGRGNPRRKTKLCPYFLNRRCLKPKEECESAHGEEDAFCTNCICCGHFKENCAKKTH